jgi:hypothetical protein
MGGEVWYNRQNLSRLAMYVIFFFISIGLSRWINGEINQLVMLCNALKRITHIKSYENIFPHWIYRAGIPAVNKNGDLLLLYVGIIDILQNYRLRKQLEHAFKSTLVTRVCWNKNRIKKNFLYGFRKKYLCVIQAIMVIVLSDFFHIKYSGKVWFLICQKK